MGEEAFWCEKQNKIYERWIRKDLHQGSACTAKPSNTSFAKGTVDVSHGSFQGFLLQSNRDSLKNPTLETEGIYQTI